MKIKKILVGVDGSAASLGRLETGFNLAESLGAAVTALCVIPLYPPTIAMGTMHGGWYVGEQLIEDRRREAMEAAEEVRDACERLAKNFKTKLGWVQQVGEMVSSACQEVRYHDILLVGKPDTLNDPQLHTSDLNGILLSSGKPVMVVPGSTPCLDKYPKNIVVAWDGSRESIQAVHHAMPFLQEADSVMLVSIYKHKERQETVEQEVKKMVSYLALHRIKASGHVLEKGRFSVAERLLDYARESESDLIVMGAYGHSRLSEIILGGATQGMLHQASLPVLFAH